MKKTRKHEKCEIFEDFQVFGFTRKILDDFQGLSLSLAKFSMMTVSFPEENHHPILGGHRFSDESDIFVGRENHTFNQCKLTIFFCQGQPL